MIDLQIRYYHRPRVVGISEAEIGHRMLPRSLRREEMALVMVDVWSDHHIATHLDRGRDITLTKIRPAMEAFRRAGATVIHAPGSEAAPKYPDRLHSVAREVNEAEPPADWPPADFRKKTGAYAGLAISVESGREAVAKILEDRQIIPEVEPEGDDVAVETGDDLHDLLHQRGILHLFYVGFAANICVPFKSYGTRAMKDRGYEIILVRDCTTAIETGDTLDGMEITKNAVRDTELNVGYTIASSELIEACDKARG